MTSNDCVTSRRTARIIDDVTRLAGVPPLRFGKGKEKRELCQEVSLFVEEKGCCIFHVFGPGL
jgi:hypothetical protein